MDLPKPQDQHRWLHQLVGQWEIDNECSMGPDQPPVKMTATETVRKLGELWIVSEARWETQGGGGQPWHSLVTLGYDPAKNAFVGTWAGSIMPMLWVYEGRLDESGRTLHLECDGPSFTDPAKTARYRDTIELVDANTRKFYSSTRGDDGKWNQFMTSQYRRKA